MGALDPQVALLKRKKFGGAYRVGYRESKIRVSGTGLPDSDHSNCLPMRRLITIYAWSGSEIVHAVRHDVPDI